jgi:hypothetical protein
MMNKAILSICILLGLYSVHSKCMRDFLEGGPWYQKDSEGREQKGREKLVCTNKFLSILHTLTW